MITKNPPEAGFRVGSVSYLGAQTVQRQRSASAGTAFAYRRAGARLRSRSSSGQADRMAGVCIRIHSLYCFNVRHAGRVDTLCVKERRKWRGKGGQIWLSGPASPASCSGRPVGGAVACTSSTHWQAPCEAQSPPKAGSGGLGCVARCA